LKLKNNNPTGGVKTVIRIRQSDL